MPKCSFQTQGRPKNPGTFSVVMWGLVGGGEWGAAGKPSTTHRTGHSTRESLSQIVNRAAVEKPTLEVSAVTVHFTVEETEAPGGKVPVRPELQVEPRSSGCRVHATPVKSGTQMARNKPSCTVPAWPFGTIWCWYWAYGFVRLAGLGGGEEKLGLRKKSLYPLRDTPSSGSPDFKL